MAKGTGENWYCRRHKHQVLHEVNYLAHKRGDCDGPNCCPKKLFEAVSVRWPHGEDFYDAEWDIRDKTFRLHKLNFGRILAFPQFPENVNPDNIEEKVYLWLNFL